MRMRSVGDAPSFSRPAVAARPDTVSGMGLARTLGENALLSLPPEAFEEDFVTRRLFGRHRIILNRPAGIQHILIDNPANYRRTTPTMRMLLPLLGRGLLLSDGEDWKSQRRTVAAAFAPRTLPALARHVCEGAQALISRLMADGGRPIDLLAEMQF